MMTPQEAEARVFTKASFGGYNIQQVDTFLDTLLEDYNTLHRENAALKSKMKLLVDKIEEYRATEDAMRRALHSAQKMADDMIREGEEKRAAAIESAQEAARQEGEALRARLSREEEEQRARIAALGTDLANEQARLEAARASTAAYVTKLKEMYTRELEYIGSLSSLTAEDLAAPEQAPAEEGAPAAGEPAEEKAEEPGKTRDFDQIRFDGTDPRG